MFRAAVISRLYAKSMPPSCSSIKACSIRGAVSCLGCSMFCWHIVQDVNAAARLAHVSSVASVIAPTGYQ